MTVRSQLIEFFKEYGHSHQTSELLADELLEGHRYEISEEIDSINWDQGCNGVGCCADTPYDVAYWLRGEYDVQQS